jgi:hypothetical protein
MKRTGVWLSDHPNADGTGATDNATALLETATEAAASGRYLILPKGTFKTTQVSLPANLIIEGQGEDTQLVVGANNTNIFQATSGGKLRIQNMRLTGDGTANSSLNGMALHAVNLADLLMDQIWMDNFAGSGVFLNSSDLNRVVEFRNIRATGMVSWATTREDAAFKLYGTLQRFHFENIDIESAAGNGTTQFPLNNGLAVSATSATSQFWTSGTIRSLRVSNVAKRGVSISHELPDPTFHVGILTLQDIRAVGCGWSGIKSKYVDRIRGTNIYCQDCEQGSTFESAGNLQGSVYINGCEDLALTNVQIINAGTDGLRLNGRNTPWSPTDLGSDAGGGQARQVINGLQVRGSKTNALATVGAGFQLGQSIQATVLNGFQGYDCFRGIEISSGTGLSPPRTFIANSPIIRRAVQAGISIAGLVGNQVGRVQINQPDIAESGRNGILCSYCDQLQINGGSITDSGTAALAGSQSGIGVSSTTRIAVRGIRSGNSVGTTQQYALYLGSGIGSIALHDNEFDGNTISPVRYVAPAKFRASNNSPWLEGTATLFDPPSLALGASTAIQTLTVPDAQIGDKVDVAWSADLLGAEIKGYVSAANTVRWYITNSAGANPLDLAAGVASATLTKRLG